MASNTLTGLIPTILEALDIVSRERVGFIPAVTRNTMADRAAVGQTVSWPVTPAMTPQDITPAATGPNPSGVTIAPASISLTKQKSIPFPWNGEDTKGALNAGFYHQTLMDQFTQAFRALGNLIEVDLGLLAYSASRAFGTAGTTPFGTASDLSDLANMLKILKDNGAPENDLHLVINTAAGLNLRGKQSLLFKVNESGTSDLLREGILGRLEGFQVGESAGVATHAPGTGSAYVIDGTGNIAVGSTLLKAKTGSGTIVAGDVLAIQSDTNRYVVGAGLAAPGTFTIGAPGLLVASVDGKTITPAASYSANLAFGRNALALATRTPAMPEGGDAAVDARIFTDPASGLAFDVRMYRQYHQVSFEVGIVWGTAVGKTEHMALLLG